MKKNDKIFLPVICLLWLLAVGLGMLKMFNYENTANFTKPVSGQWPAASHLQREEGVPTLVLALHPKCPCSRATIGELEQIMINTNKKFKAYALFIQPAEFSENWVHSDTWQKAGKIPGVTVIVDPEGQEIRRFHAVTSGQTFFYDGEGKLLFSGGITASRGHSGDNLGRSTITALLAGQSVSIKETPAFGCFLFNETEEKKEN